MTNNVKHSHHPLFSLWIKSRFYVFIVLITAFLLTALIWLNNAAHVPENIISAVLSLCNAIIAYIVSKKKQKNRAYKKMMKTVYIWTLIRFFTMLSVLLILILTKTVEALPLIFSFIGFYIIHQLIEIGMMQLEVKLSS
ncbi:MAG: hypothetical protein KAT14_07180 [Candidatus Marinimicrobia bacterium]|nr:hypothetical protein [Candidatus Neomarinimicrobiota bacterium]